MKTVHVFIENEAGSQSKNLYNEKTLEHIKSVPVSAAYPYPYGFVIDTTSGDGDNVDCFVLTSQSLECGQTLEVIPVGLLEMHEDGQIDHKVLARINDETAVTDDERQTITDFIATVFDHLPGKVMNVGNLAPAGDARDFIANNRDVPHTDT